MAAAHAPGGLCRSIGPAEMPPPPSPAIAALIPLPDASGLAPLSRNNAVLMPDKKSGSPAMEEPPFALV